MTGDLRRRIEERSARPPMGEGRTVRHDEFLLDLGGSGIGGTGAGVVESSEFGFKTEHGDVDGAGDRPVAAIQAGDMDIRVLVDLGELGVVEGGRLADRRHPTCPKLGIHAGIDVLEALAARLASTQGRLEFLGGRVGCLDHGQDIVQEAWNGDQFLEILLISHGEDSVDGGFLVDVPGHAAPFW